MNDDLDKSEDTRAPMAKAMDLVSQITTISLVSVLPAVGGYFIDKWLGTEVIFLLLGLALGMTAAGFQMASLVKRLDPANIDQTIHQKKKL